MAKKKVEVGKVDSKVATTEGKKDEPIENWAGKPDSDIYEKCMKFYPLCATAYENREEADEGCIEYWNIFNCDPDDNQTYQGNSKCYVPAVRDAINARTKRALAQNFSQKYKHVDAIGTDGQKPFPQLALLEHYIRSTKLKSIVRSIYVAGDVTGQWNVYIDWLRDIRSVTGMIKRNPILETIGGEDLGDELQDPSADKEEVLEDEEVITEGPTITDFATEDMVVIPPTCNDIEKAEIVCLKLRMSKEQVKLMVDDGVFILPEGTDLGDWVTEKKGEDKRNPPKARSCDAGIKSTGTSKHALIFEVTVRLKFPGDDHKSLAYVYYAGENDIVGIIKAPQWGQKRPIISAPVDRIGGSFNGISKIEAVKWMQWNLNDFWNMGQDSAMYSMLPIVMTDPEQNPNYAMMVYGLAAVWPVNPNTTKFASFPALWKDSIQMCGAIKEQIHESLDVNPAMMGVQPKGRKNAGAVGAQQQEQSVAILDHAQRFEEEMLNEILERMFEYDAQFREEDLTVLTMGEIGVKAAMMTIEPQQWGNRYYFQWVGTDYVMNMQRMQQQIATMNVLRGIPPQQLNGRRLDITPILEILTDNVFGPELSGKILIDDRNKYTVSAEIEDEMMVNGIPVDVHEADNDSEHLQKHRIAGQASGDTTGLIRNHMQQHMMAMQKKREMAQPQPGSPGVPGGAAPGVAGSGPRPGAQVAGPQGGAQQPAGAIHPDQIAGGTPRG
jgi:hypothetical protein